MLERNSVSVGGAVVGVAVIAREDLSIEVDFALFSSLAEKGCS